MKENTCTMKFVIKNVYKMRKQLVLVSEKSEIEPLESQADQLDFLLIS